jgi:hypothetical protein
MRKIIFTGRLRTVNSTLLYVSDRVSIIQSVNLISHIFFKVFLVNKASYLHKQWEFRRYKINTIPKLRKFIVDRWTSPVQGRYASVRLGLPTRRLTALVRQGNTIQPDISGMAQARPSAERALEDLRVPKATPVDPEILPTGESGPESDERKERMGTAIRMLWKWIVMMVLMVLMLRGGVLRVLLGLGRY